MTLGDVSASTKVPRSALELLESGSLSGLPAHVFVRGFIRSYAKAVGLAESQPLSLFDRAVGAKSEAAKVEAEAPVVDPALAGGVPDNEEEINRRRGEAERRSDIPLTNFRGIEIRHFSCEIARLALIIADYQCDVLRDVRYR